MNELEEFSLDRKRALRKKVNHIVRGVLFYNIIITAVAIMGMIIQMIVFMVQNPETLKAETMPEQILVQIMDTVMASGTFYIAGLFLGLAFLLLYSRKDIPVRELFRTKRTMTGGAFFQLVCVLMASQFLFSLFGIGLEMLLNCFGYSVMEEMNVASADSSTFSMFLYASFMGPVAEELVYRGFVLKNLRKYGTSFAIVISSLLFAFMHGNLVQGFFAFFVGLILGYLAVEYSLSWSILLHIVNNFLFGEALSFFLEHSGLSSSVQEAVSTALMVFFFLAGMTVLYKNRKAIKAYQAENKAPKGSAQAAALSFWLILFCILEFLVAFSGIQAVPCSGV